MTSRFYVERQEALESSDTYKIIDRRQPKNCGEVHCDDLKIAEFIAEALNKAYN